MKLYTCDAVHVASTELHEQPPMLDPELADLVSTFLSCLSLALERLTDPYEKMMGVMYFKQAWKNYDV